MHDRMRDVPKNPLAIYTSSESVLCASASGEGVANHLAPSPFIWNSHSYELWFISFSHMALLLLEETSWINVLTTANLSANLFEAVLSAALNIVSYEFLFSGRVINDDWLRRCELYPSNVQWLDVSRRNQSAFRVFISRTSSFPAVSSIISNALVWTWIALAECGPFWAAGSRSVENVTKSGVVQNIS